MVIPVVGLKMDTVIAAMTLVGIKVSLTSPGTTGSWP